MHRVSTPSPHSNNSSFLMRIIGGTHGGRIIKTPKGLPVRPTTDRTKEALFNTLQHRLAWSETTVCDLFAGTGNISFECCSRGAKQVLAVEKHPKCIRAIQQAAHTLGLAQLEVHQADAFRFAASSKMNFDFIFMDPPYELPNQPELVHQLLDRLLKDTDSLLVVEHRSQYDFSDLPGFESVRKYGSSSLSFFSKND